MSGGRCGASDRANGEQAGRKCQGCFTHHQCFQSFHADARQEKRWRIQTVPGSTRGRRSHPRGDLIKMGPPGRHGVCGTLCRPSRYGPGSAKVQLDRLSFRDVCSARRGVRQTRWRPGQEHALAPLLGDGCDPLYRQRDPRQACGGGRRQARPCPARRFKTLFSHPRLRCGRKPRKDE